MADSRKSLINKVGTYVKQIGLNYNKTRITEYREKYNVSPQNSQKAKQTSEKVYYIYT